MIALRTELEVGQRDTATAVPRNELGSPSSPIAVTTNSLLMIPQPDTKLTHSPPTIIRQLRASDLKYVLTDLTDVFVHTVNNGSPLGFLTPISRETARDYWISLIPELQPGGRILLIAANEDGRIIGSGQLALSQRQNSPHRAELQKLFVAPAARGQGVGATLVHALHRVGRQHGRTLITLSTRQGEAPEGFYKSLGYKEAGVIPGWTIGPDGQAYDHVTLYHELGT